MQHILDFFYIKASNRIKERIIKSGLTYDEIHHPDSKLISRIVNKKITKNNPYLIPDSVIRTFYKDDQSEDMIPCGLLETKALKFNNEREILWGTKEEILLYLKDLFILLWSEVTNTDLKYEIDRELYLCDYVPYAKYRTYWNILFSPENKLPAIFYGIKEDTVMTNIDSAEEDALQFLYRKCQPEFQRIFLSFTEETTTFHKIDKVLKEKLIEKRFIPMLDHFAPDNNSLGLRVRDLINADLSKCASILCNSYSGNVEYLRNLIHASSEYVLALEKIQESLITKGN